MFTDLHEKTSQLGISPFKKVSIKRPPIWPERARIRFYQVEAQLKFILVRRFLLS